MTFWIILSWVLVAAFTGVNVVLFLKLKQASQQMMKMAFPSAKNMNDAVAQMQSMMQGLGNRRPGAGMGGMPGGMNNPQLKAAMDLLKDFQKKK